MHNPLRDMPENNSRVPLVSRRHLLIGGALAVASGVAFARQPKVHNPIIPLKKFETWIPENFRNWSKLGSSGVLLPPPDALSDRLYDNLITGTYQAPDRPFVMLLLAYNNRQDGVLQVHRPEVCYPVGGYQLSETTEFNMTALGRNLPGNIFTAVGPERTEQVVYFTRLGDAFPRTWAEQRIAVAKENLAGRIPDGFMMRVSILDSNQSVAQELLGEFTQAFIEAAPRPLQQLIFG